MKKLFVVLAVAAVTLVACKKEEVKFAEEQNQINFKAVTGIATKGAELDGTALPTDWLLYAAATSSQNDSYFTNQQFKKFAAANWQATADGTAATPIYWPLGGAQMDFLAFAVPAGKYGTGAGQIQPAFASPKVATGFTVTGWDVYTNEFELLYAANNGLTSTPDPVALQFQHALSLVMFNVKLGTAITSEVKINSITFDALVKSGDFALDNSKNKLVATWTPATATANTPFAIDATAAAHSTVNTTAEAANFVNNTTDLKAQITWAQLGETKMMIPQPAQNFTINYTIGSNTLSYNVNVPRQMWEAGKAYLYNITINLNEITVAPTVVDWVVASPETAIALQ